MSMGGLESDLEDLYRRRHGAFQVMLSSVTGSVESAMVRSRILRLTGEAFE